MEREGSKKSYKLLKVLFLLLILSTASLYILDEYVFPKKMSVHYTKKPSYERDIVESRSQKKPLGDDIEKAVPEKKEYSPTPKPEIPKVKKYKSIEDIMKVLSVSYGPSVINDWEYNIERAKGNKLEKGIYNLAELGEWDLDMHGEINAARLKNGVEEFYKEPEPKAEEKKVDAVKEEVAQGDESQYKLEGEAGEAVPEEPQKEEKPKKEEPKKRERMDAYSYKIKRFMPGHADDGYFEDYEGVDFKASASGKPDFEQGGFTKPDEYKEQFLPLGHGGSIVYEIVGGEVIDGDGPDFVIYADSAFSDNAETAKVEVAFDDNASSYVEFGCDSVNPPFFGCAGVHPVKAGGNDVILLGGDAFDLKKIGLKKIRFIKITDTGNNVRGTKAPYTSGLDLDSISLVHAYKPLDQ